MLSFNAPMLASAAFKLISGTEYGLSNTDFIFPYFAVFVYV